MAEAEVGVEKYMHLVCDDEAGDGRRGSAVKEEAVVEVVVMASTAEAEPEATEAEVRWRRG